MMVTEGRISLRASAYTELLTWLATAARTPTDEEVPPELGAAVPAYRRSLANDDDDTRFAAIFRAVAPCTDDRCAIAAVANEGFGSAYGRSLGPFVVRGWGLRGSAALDGIDVARAGLSTPEAEALSGRAASELGVTWPAQPIAVDIVAEVPPPGRIGLVPPALASRGACFARERKNLRDVDRVADARLLDCILVQAMLAIARAEPPAIARALVRSLGPSDGGRAFELVVIHSVATVVKGWEPRHASVYRRAAITVAAPALAWVAREWRRPEEPEAFAARLYAAWPSFSEPAR